MVVQSDTSNGRFGAEVSIDAQGIHLYRNIEAYFDVGDEDWVRISLTPEQATALGRLLIAVTNAEG